MPTKEKPRTTATTWSKDLIADPILPTYDGDWILMASNMGELKTTRTDKITNLIDYDYDVCVFWYWQLKA